MGPSPELAKKILLRIDAEERRRFWVKTAAFGAALLGSVALIAYGAMATAADASQSGFFAFVSLLFSDFSVAMASFSDFAFSLAESMPVFPIIMLLSGILLALWSAAGFVDKVGKARHHVFSAL